MHLPKQMKDYDQRKIWSNYLVTQSVFVQVGDRNGLPDQLTSGYLLLLYGVAVSSEIRACDRISVAIHQSVPPPLNDVTAMQPTIPVIVLAKFIFHFLNCFRTMFLSGQHV